MANSADTNTRTKHQLLALARAAAVVCGLTALILTAPWTPMTLVGLLSLIIAFALERPLDRVRHLSKDNQFQALYREAAIGIYRSSAEGKPIFANNAFVRMMGYDDEATWLQRANDVAIEWYVDPTRRAEFVIEIEKAGSVTNFQSQIYRHATREVIWVSETARVVRDRHGRTRYYEGTIEDISARVDAAAKLEAAKDVAERANRMKSEFLANMSHELRTPLNGVLGMSELLSATALNPQQKQYTDVLARSGDTLMCVINDILDFSKAEAGRLELRAEPFDIRQAAEDVSCLLAPRALQKGLEFAQFTPPEAKTHVVGDHQRIRQILLNLIGNAIKFTDAGHIIVTIDGRRREDMVDLSISVEDTGVGIPTEHLARIFEKFEQVDGSSTRAKGGSGLGLSISQKLVALMGGEIKVQSEPGKGSRFSFEISLPAANAANADHPPPAAPSIGRILVLDRCQPTRDLIAAFARSLGGEAVTAHDLPAAIAALTSQAHESRAFDATFIDGGRNNAQGADMLAALTSVPGVKLGRRILIARIAEMSQSPAADRSGFDSRLIKPLRAAEVIAALRGIRSEPPEDRTMILERRRPAVINPALISPAEGALHILLAEDNAVNRMVVRNMLAGTGWTLDEVENGREAVEAADRTVFTAILMDVSMPEMDGIDATKEIRRRERTAGRPPVAIIGLTAHVLDEQRNQCLESGMTDYLTKPVRRNALLSAIREAQVVSQPSAPRRHSA